MEDRTDRSNSDVDARLDSFGTNDTLNVVDFPEVANVEEEVTADILELLKIVLDPKVLNQDDYSALKVA